MENACIAQQSVPIVMVCNEENKYFSLLDQHTPVILRGLNLGECTKRWKDVDYLKSKISLLKKVTVHVCNTNVLNFIEKNFQYKITDFHTLLDKCFPTTSNYSNDTVRENYYLRAVGENQRKDIAYLPNDFPTISDDVLIPDLFPAERLFSSVLRISSSLLQLWTHYDIMNNILMQIVGRKKVVLFDPSDAPYLYLSGDKSKVLDVENPDLNVYPLFKEAKQHVCVLEEGDVLFIPALWFHNTIALTAGIAVNVFWKNLDDEFYDAKDLYGNRDLTPAQRAFQASDKICKNLDSMPEPYRRFYAFRLVENIRQKFNL